MANLPLLRFKTISQYHLHMGLPKPEHPLISVINFENVKQVRDRGPQNYVLDFYSIALKRNVNIRFRYGQQEYDFNEGVLFFIAPDQVYGVEAYKEEEPKRSGWMLLIHPDFLWNTPLARTIRQYEYFGYSVNEALFLSPREESTLITLMQSIGQEYVGNPDNFSQPVMIAQLELLLIYAERFYHRQFLTRKIANHQILSRLEEILTTHFNSDAVENNGLPTVQCIADSLHVSPNYLSGLLKVLTGQSTQQHIHNKVIEKAKEKLSTTNLSVSEIAYELGFEHPQSFSKLFKTKTNQSPLEFRQLFT
ncbi:helix-turn-helix transcriptional regulator [Rhodocytophaga aerolata]|uniref:Helix-turn-helix transcriptional regulator n=1 Tax=Rhodocytophaga aerolata TaxID=455078 RepID=A0ABT8REX3_9BACT|nr:response regulator transcription factor [Rhodocytophaga aerolata]MDO1449728.1 helix-turn-helix transcriptional regulator [Rhodocytophaga aerolata]